MRAVVTGASGFIGSALCRELLSRGWEVAAVARPESRNLSRIPAEAEKLVMPLDGLFGIGGRFDVFFHLAWGSAAWEARDGFSAQQKDIALTGTALMAAKKLGCRRFVGAGSQAEYGIVRSACSEERVPRPFMMYGAAKLAACHMGGILACQLGLEFVWPRIYSVYGEGESPGTLISYVVSSLIGGKTPELTECDTMWDFLYVSDCARALRLLGEKKLGEYPCVCNVSYGDPHRLRTFVERARDIISPGSRLWFGARPLDRERTFWLEPDTTRLRTLTGFEPEVDFSAGIRKTKGWIMESKKKITEGPE